MVEILIVAFIALYVGHDKVLMNQQDRTLNEPAQSAPAPEVSVTNY